MIQTFRGALCAIAIAFALPSAASAGVIVDTGTPPGGGSSSVMSYHDPDSFQYLASRFHLDTTTVLTDLEGFIGGVGGTFHISIAAQSGDEPDVPGAVQFMQQASADATEDGDWFGLHGASWSLASGDWWIVFSVDPTDTITRGFMPNGAPNALPQGAFFNQSSNGLWVRDDPYLNIGVRINGSAAPEPATWALMIGGFALTGGALRRRRALASI